MNKYQKLFEATLLNRLAPGDMAYNAKTGETGLVISDDTNGDMVIQIGNKKVKISADDFGKYWSNLIYDETP